MKVKQFKIKKNTKTELDFTSLVKEKNIAIKHE